MTVRPLDLLDLPVLRRYRHAILPLDSAWALTRGSLLGGLALLSYLNPRRHIYTAVSNQPGSALIGQVMHREGENAAHLTFLAPAEQLGEGAVPLLDTLCVQAGSWGVAHLMAEVDERTAAFKEFRQAGFSMYAWQRVWKLAFRQTAPVKSLWQPSEDTDLPAIQSLYSQIVPALLQAVESLPRRNGGLVCRKGNGTNAYVALAYGPAGIWVQPFIHPDSACVPEALVALLHDLPRRAGRPVYLCVRAYQAWLEAMLEELGAAAGPRQAVMVKHLAARQHETQALRKTEKALAKPATPVAGVALHEDIPPKP